MHKFNQDFGCKFAVSDRRLIVFVQGLLLILTNKFMLNFFLYPLCYVKSPMTVFKFLRNLDSFHSKRLFYSQMTGPFNQPLSKTLPSHHNQSNRNPQTMFNNCSCLLYYIIGYTYVDIQVKKIKTYLQTTYPDIRVQRSKQCILTTNKLRSRSINDLK